MIRSLTTSAIAATVLSAVAAQATELTFSGSVDAGYISVFDSMTTVAKSGYNLEANLGMEAKLSDMVSAHVYGASLAGAVPTTFAPSRWPGFAFDGADLTIKSGANTYVVGDIVVAKGSISYYAAKRFSTVTRVSAVRGASATIGDQSIFIGADDARDSLYTLGSSRMFAFDSTSSLEASAITHFGDGDSLSWGGGFQYKAKFGSLSVSASAAGFGGKNYKGDEVVGYVLSAEPIYTTDAYYVSGFALFAPTGDDSTHTVFSYPVRHGRTYAPWAEDLTVYIEPGVNFAEGKAAFGLPIEYHEPNLDIKKNEKIAFVPSLYAFPVKDATITLWGEADLYTSEQAMTYSMGLETVFKF